MTNETELTIQSDRELLLKDRSILEREVMEFRPFGTDEQGATIRDLSGMSVRAVVVYLEDSLTRERGASAGSRAIEELCCLLNQRIRDPVYHVTPKFLKNAWNSYSYEFAAYLYEFCERMSGDSRFLFRGGMEKASSIMQVLARPFSLAQIYSMFPYFGNKFASGSIEFRVIEVRPSSATLAMKFSDRTLRQFGPYRRRCAYLVCQAAQGIMAAVPVRVHGLPPATLTELSCVANDDEWCRWEIHWQMEKQGTWRQRLRRMVAGSEINRALQTLPEPSPSHESAETTLPKEHVHDRGAELALLHAAASSKQSQRHVTWSFWGALAGVTLAVGLYAINPSASVGEIILLGLVPMLVAGILI